MGVKNFAVLCIMYKERTPMFFVLCYITDIVHVRRCNQQETFERIQPLVTQDDKAKTTNNSTARLNCIIYIDVAAND